MLRSPPPSSHDGASNVTSDNNNNEFSGNNNSEMGADNDNTKKRLRGRPRKTSNDDSADSEVICQMKKLFLDSEKKAIDREMIMRDDINKIKSDIGNLIEFKFEENLAVTNGKIEAKLEEHLIVINEKIMVVADSLGAGIDKNSNDIVHIKETLDSLQAQLNAVEAVTGTHAEQLESIKTVPNLETEILDRMDRKANLLLHGVPESVIPGLTNRERAEIDRGKVTDIIRDVCPSWDIPNSGNFLYSFRLSIFSETSTNPRLIKMRFCNNIIRDEFKSAFIKCKINPNMPQNLKKLTISDDLTQCQLKKLHNLKDQLRLPDNSDKVIKFVRGQHVLVKRKVRVRQQQQSPLTQTPQ